jgi:TonB family protein
MGYTALLFCPDEKTARTVTQVLGDLEFSVETCAEPFAAVKKLMGQHFDALVVDCDNEQNATLLFKSARNSTSNQASLAVAVVEGQAGVAKAFRIGANLVLTKPINVEQAKGTLRVARGLLRKGEPGKPAAAPSPGATTPQAAAPAKAAAPKAVAPAKPVAPTAVSAPRPAAPPVPKPAPPLAKPAAAVASAAPAAGDDDLLEINVDDSPSTPAPAAVAPPAPKVAAPVPAPVAESKPVFKAAPPVPTFGSGAASAPAPAREAESHKQDSHVAEAAPVKTDTVFEEPVEAAHTDSTHPEVPAPTFSFGGANAPVESSGGRNKIFLGIAAAVVVIVGGYLAWSHFSGSKSETPAPAPLAASQPATPGNVPAKPAVTSPAASSPSASTAPASASSTSLPSSSSHPAAQPVKEATAPDTNVDAEDQPADDGSASARTTDATKSAPSKSGTTAKSAAPAPLMVRGGVAPAIHKTPAAPDAPAPSVIGMATPSANAPPLNLVASSANAPKPVLQTLNISQGVSQGLLIKKVQPTYPQNALTMHVEGSVDMLATISKTGNITAVKVVKGEPLLSRAASDAVKQWKYKPYLLNGEPVEIQTEITVNFKLPH